MHPGVNKLINEKCEERGEVIFDFCSNAQHQLAAVVVRVVLVARVYWCLLVLPGLWLEQHPWGW